MKSLKIPLPPLTEQKSIAKVLSDLDEKIEINNTINKNLEAIGKAIFKRWFVDFEFENENGTPYQSNGGKMVYNEELEKEIPKGWEVGRLGDKTLTEFIKSGIEEFKNQKIYLATADVENTQIKNNKTKISFNKKPSRANMQPIKNSVWFARMKESRKLIFFDDYKKNNLKNYILSTGFCGLKCLENSLYYIWFYIQGLEFENLKNNLASGAVQVSINNENIAKINLLIPPKKLLEKFNYQSKIISKKIYNNELENQKLKNIRDYLLPKLIKGKIRIRE